MEVERSKALILAHTVISANPKKDKQNFSTKLFLCHSKKFRTKKFDIFQQSFIFKNNLSLKKFLIGKIFELNLRLAHLTLKMCYFRIYRNSFGQFDLKKFFF